MSFVGAVLMVELDVMKDAPADAAALIDSAFVQLDASLPSMGANLPL